MRSALVKGPLFALLATLAGCSSGIPLAVEGKPPAALAARPGPGPVVRDCHPLPEDGTLRPVPLPGIRPCLPGPNVHWKFGPPAAAGT